MTPFSLYCKSYKNDLSRIKILTDSIKRYNKDNLDFYISVPSSDLDLFKNSFGSDYIKFISDDDIYPNVNHLKGWESQQIIKSSFWKLNLCENYLMIDSDSYFIKPFGISDFMYDTNTPFTVMHEQKDLFSWSSKNHTVLGFNPRESFVNDRLLVMDVFDRSGKIFDFGPSPVIWSSKVWKSLEDIYLKPNDITFQDLINKMPSEFSWYGEWLLYSKCINIIPIEPIFKCFHYLQQYNEYKNRGYTLDHWKENYIGVVMQSSSNLPLEY